LPGNIMAMPRWQDGHYQYVPSKEIHNLEEVPRVILRKLLPSSISKGLVLKKTPAQQGGSSDHS
jgi:hypothetical protein